MERKSEHFLKFNYGADYCRLLPITADWCRSPAVNSSLTAVSRQFAGSAGYIFIFGFMLFAEGMVTKLYRFITDLTGQEKFEGSFRSR